jgi:transposase
VSVFRFIATRRVEHSVKRLCRVLGVSRSGYQAWERRAPSGRDLADAWLGERIREIDAESRQTYGARRVHAALRHRGVRVGRRRVERLMRRLGLSGLVPKRFRRTTIRVPGVRVAGDLVARDFNPSGPNQLWVADIKYVRSWQGWLYLAAVVDCYSRRVVGWSMRTDLEAELVVDALEMAVARRRPRAGLGRRLRQRGRRIVLRLAREGPAPTSFVRDPRRSTQRGLRLHRNVLQPDQASLNARLPVADRIREDEDRRRRESSLATPCPPNRGRSSER